MSRSHSFPWLVTLAVVLLFAILSPVRSAQDSSGEEIERYLQDFNSGDDLIIYEAVNALGKIGLPAVPYLIRLFESGSLDTRRRAAMALDSIGEPATPALLEALQSDSPQVRWMAAFTLGQDHIVESFTYAEAIHYAMLEALQDPHPMVRIMAAESLWEFTDESAMPAFLDEDRDRNLSRLVQDLHHEEKEVRLEAIIALTKLTELDPLLSKNLEADLTESLTDPSPRVRAIAAHTLGQMGKAAETAIPELMQALKDPDPLVRGSAARALGEIGEPASGAIPQLQNQLDDPNQDARGGAAVGLAALGDHSQRVIVELREELKDSDEDTRELAALELGAMGSTAKSAVPDLRELMDDIYPEVRRASALALGRIGEAASSATPELVRGLSDRDPLVRNYSARALGRVGKAAEIAVHALRLSLEDRDPTVRANAAHSLGQIGLQAEVVIPDLTKLLEDPNPLARKFSAEALAKISVSIQEAAKGLSSRELDQAITDLEVTRGKLLAATEAGAGNRSNYRNALATVDLSIDALNTQKYGMYFWLKENWIAVLLIGYLIVLPLIWRMMLWLRPLWLFRINRALEPYEFAAPRVLSDKNRISTRYLILVGFYYKHPRVLDAWVESQLDTVRSAFEKKSFVRSHSVHVPLPMDIDGETVTGLTTDDLVPTFSRPTNCLLVRGEGGTGKMSIAMQIAQMAMAENESGRLCSHPMFPIVIDRKLSGGGKDLKDKKKGAEKSDFESLVEVARGQLQNLLHAPEPLSSEVITALLKRPSILLIAHDLSEKNTATRDQFRPDLPDFPANSLVVTSRTDERLGEVMKTTIRPLRIAADQYRSFLEDYASQVGKAALLSEEEFGQAADRFSQMVGNNHVPVSVAKLHAERTVALIAAKKGGPDPDIRISPENVPDLLLAYVNETYPALATGKQGGIDPESAFDGLKAIAWECMKQSLRPRAAKRQEILTVLGGEDAQDLLQYLIKQSSLLQEVGAARDSYRFTFEVLAEYLAAMHLVETWGGDEEAWATLLQKVEELPGASANAMSFLHAVEVCSDLSPGRVPDSVVEKMRTWIGSAT